MALAKLVSFEMHRGDDREITAQVVDSAGAAVDVTSATFTWILSNKDAKSSNSKPAPKGVALETKTIGDGIVLVTPASGQIRIDIDSADTVGEKAAAEQTKYYHELQMVLGGKTTTVMFGVITLSRDIIAPGP